MRIITGKHKGRKLLELKKMKDLRPTTDKNRETLFNILGSATFLKNLGFDLAKSDLLDVFSGTGSISFEALSRGVKSVTLMEKDYKHLDLSKENAKMLQEEKNCNFINFDLSKPLFKSNQQYNLIYIDPPYNKGLIENTIQNLLTANFIKKDAIIITESSIYEKINLEELKNITFLEERIYSKTIFTFFKA